MLGNIYKKVYDADATAIKFKGKNISYGELDDAVNKYATFFYQLGVKDGKRVILTCPNSPEFIYSYFGVVKTGAIIVPINVQLTIEEIKYFINDSEAEYIIIHPKIIENLNQSQETLQGLLGIKLIVLDQGFQTALTLNSYSVLPARRPPWSDYPGPKPVLLGRCQDLYKYPGPGSYCHIPI
jgi:long-chain acyl-CoA synthetase